MEQVYVALLIAVLVGSSLSTESSPSSTWTESDAIRRSDDASTQQTEAISSLVLSFLSAEVAWRRLMAQGSIIQLAAIAIAGVVVTFFAFFVPLLLLYGGISVAVAAIKGALTPVSVRRRDADEGTADFRLIEGVQWIEQMRLWLEERHDQNIISDRYRCCSIRDEGIIRCFALFDDGHLPPACSSQTYRDVYVGQASSIDEKDDV